MLGPGRKMLNAAYLGDVEYLEYLDHLTGALSLQGDQDDQGTQLFRQGGLEHLEFQQAKPRQRTDIICIYKK